jgi:hypothetical protein
VYFKNDMWHNIGRTKLFDIIFIKEFQIMKGPLKVDILITSKIDRYRLRAILFL